MGWIPEEGARLKTYCFIRKEGVCIAEKLGFEDYAFDGMLLLVFDCLMQIWYKTRLI
jgi:hypothetical protein